MRHVLSNGLTVLLHEQRVAPVVTLQMWVKVGSADELPRESGLAHVHEHMIFKGTAKRGVGEIARDVEASGGEINAWTSFDATVYYLVMSSRFFDNGLDIISDALTGATFDATELERESEVIIEEIKRGRDMPSREVGEELFELAFAKHPYRRPILGLEKTVRGFSRADVLDFYGRHYVPENMVLVAVGDFEEAVAFRKIRAALEGWQPPRPAATVPHENPRVPEPAQRAMRAHALRRDVQEAHFQLGWHIPELRHAHTPALDLFAIAIGQGESSRLVTRLRRKTALMNEVYAYSYTPRDPGIFLVGGTAPPEKAEKATRELLIEVYRAARDGVASEELEKAKTIIESDLVTQKQTVQGMARKLGFYEVTAGDLAFEEAYHQAVARTTDAQIREAASHYLRNENLTAVSLVPDVKGKHADLLSVKRLKELADEAWREVHGTPARKVAARAAKTEPEVIRKRLRNGLTVLVQEDHNVPLVSVRAAFVAGQRFENERTAGLSNLIGRLVTRGTGSRTGEAIAEEIEAMAGSLDGYAGRNSFGIHLESLTRGFPRAFELLADCLLDARFPEDELEHERRLVLEEIRSREDNPSALAFELFAETLWKKHPYRWPSHGVEASVKRFTRRTLLDYRDRWLVPSRLVLAVCGDVKAEDLLARVEDRFGAAGKKSGKVREPRVPLEALPDAPREAHLDKAREQCHIVLGFPGVTMHARDRFALQVLSGVLSGQGGRLFVELRDRQSLAYSVSSFSVEGLDPGYFAVYIGTSPDKREVAMRGIDAELERIRKEAVTADELDRARTYLVGSHDIGLQRPSARASAIALNEAYGLGWRELATFPNHILAVTAADVLRVARKYLDPQRRVLAVVGPGAERASRGGRRSKQG